MDEALILAEEYQALILRHEGISGKQWSENPEIILDMRSRKVANAGKLTGREDRVQTELKATISDIIGLIEKDGLTQRLPLA